MVLRTSTPLLRPFAVVLAHLVKNAVTDPVDLGLSLRIVMPYTLHSQALRFASDPASPECRKDLRRTESLNTNTNLKIGETSDVQKHACWAEVLRLLVLSCLTSHPV